MKRSTDNILQELAREQAKLSELERSRDEARARIESLRSELAAGLATTTSISLQAVSAKCDVPNTSSGKVRLFRSLFRGRTDRKQEIRGTRQRVQTNLRQGFAYSN